MLAKLTFLLCALSVSLFGQAGLGTINGTALDHSGAVVPGAQVRVVQLSTKSTREVVSNAQGIFNLPSLVPGGYTLTVKAPGFKEEATAPDRGTLLLSPALSATI